MRIFTIIGILAIVIGFMMYQAFAAHQWHKNHHGEETIAEIEYFYGYFFYLNPDDSRLVVLKHSGGGFTLNFANPLTVISSLLLVGGIAALLIIKH